MKSTGPRQKWGPVVFSGDAMREIPAELWKEVEAAYASPGRAYHTLEHVREVLRRLDEVQTWEHPDEVLLAALFHDAVYVPGAKDNEARSAELARAAAARHFPRADTDRVARLILLTARHGLLTPADVEAEDALFLDCDMAILAADAAEFDAYDRGVAAEYAQVPRELYQAGRRAFLSGLLAKPRIFLSDFFHARLDARARANLRRALATYV
jgi:predicted metal-dependent HD superfamily phosphohydrolase